MLTYQTRNTNRIYMMKRIISILLIFIAISCDTTPKKSNSLIEYIPRDAQVIIKINNLDKSSSSLRDNHFIKTNNQLAFIQYFKKLSILDQTHKNEGLLCFSPRGKNDFEYTYVSKFDPQLIEQDSIHKKNIKTINYDEHVIYEITTGGDNFYATRQDSILIASSSQLLIENAIRIQANPLPIDSDLQKVYNVSGTDNNLSVLINGKKLKSLHNSLLPKTTLEDLGNFSGWTSLDATIEQNAIKFDGIAVEKDSLSSTIGIFDNTIAQTNQLSKITPTGAKGFISYTYDDFLTLKNNLSRAQDRDVEDIPNQLDEVFAGISEIGLIFLEKEKVLVLNAIDGTSTAEELNGEKADTYRNISIFRYSDAAIFSQVLHPLVQDFEGKFYFVKDDFVVFGSSMSALRDIIANVLNQTLLDQQGYYSSAVNGLSNEASILAVSTIKNIKEYVSANAKEDYQKELEDVKDKGYEIGALQIIKENDFAHIHGILQKNAAKGSATSVSQAASTTLENKILNTPVLVKNHRSKGMDATIQDIDNNLYLISDKGSIFWKKQIDGEILGEIQQIDIYKNGRYQLLFNTANTLYLVDRDGNDVAPYPKKFDTPITQPLSLFDYDKSKRYRIVITQGNQVKMFNAEGDIVTGFGFKGTETDIILPPKHIRIGTKDYLLFAEKNGTLSILDRLGRPRVTVKDKVDFSQNQWYQYQDKFTSTTKDGKLIQILTDGSAVTQNLKLTGENSGMVATNKTLVTFSENKLSIKGRTIELEYGVYTKPQLFYINNKIYVTITDTQAKKVFLYDSNAELLPNFPVYGNSVISMGNMDKDPNLEFVVQGEDNSILIYQIN